MTCHDIQMCVLISCLAENKVDIPCSALRIPIAFGCWVQKGHQPRLSDWLSDKGYRRTGTTERAPDILCIFIKSLQSVTYAQCSVTWEGCDILVDK